MYGLHPKCVYIFCFLIEYINLHLLMYRVHLNVLYVLRVSIGGIVYVFYICELTNCLRCPKMPP